jgi:hypothetical protein
MNTLTTEQEKIDCMDTIQTGSPDSSPHRPVAFPTHQHDIQMKLLLGWVHSTQESLIVDKRAEVHISAKQQLTIRLHNGITNIKILK